tara:strand:+ start:185 stop:1372 length:1188 start_codon:yes stop_codon:yes gene_type:complete
MSLTDLKIRSLKPEDKPRRYTDGGNLFVEVRPTGSKLWRFAYKFDGKQKLMALGSYPEISLAKAREKRAEARALLFEGIDPMQQAKIDKLERQALTEHTFSAIAKELLEKNRKEGLAETTLSKKAWLIGIANADLANMSVTQVKPAHVLVPLRKVEADGNYETARRLRAVISQVFRYAVATARCEHDPTAGLRGALIVPKVRHRPAIVDRDGFAGLVRAIWGYDGAIETQAGLQLMALLYPRPGELRLSKWNEFNLQKRIWTIPAERTKMRREHRKPLSEPAVKILKRLESVTGHEPWVFVSQLSRGKPISENTLNGALRRLGFSANEMTSHGFRASASSLLNESGKWHPDAIEAELAHMGADQVRKAYHRATYWDQRVEMAEWWAAEIMNFAAS